MKRLYGWWYGHYPRAIRKRILSFCRQCRGGFDRFSRRYSTNCRTAATTAGFSIKLKQNSFFPKSLNEAPKV